MMGRLSYYRGIIYTYGTTKNVTWQDIKGKCITKRPRQQKGAWQREWGEARKIPRQEYMVGKHVARSVRGREWRGNVVAVGR